MKVVSLFAGIGGFDLGFQQAGFEIAAHVERDAQCRKLLDSKFPTSDAFYDVNEANGMNLPKCDVLCGGWPCQDLSVAGKRAGLSGARSGLFYQFTRIANELKPTFIVWENVPGLLSSDGGRDFRRVLMEFRRIGYHGAWRTLDAQYLGVAQRRRRVFGCFARGDIGAESCAEILSIFEGVRRHPAPRREAVARVANSITRGLGSGGADDNKAQGNHLISARSSGQGFWMEDDKSATLGTARSVHESTLVAHALTSGGSDASEDGTGRGTPLVVTPQAFDLRGRDGGAQMEGPHDTANIRAAAGGSSRSYVAFAAQAGGKQTSLGYDESSETSPALSTSQLPALAGRSGVRRLTPKECERLQGFPDGWTEGFSDSTRYRMLGNAVAVPVARWIAERLKKHLCPSNP